MTKEFFEHFSERRSDHFVKTSKDVSSLIHVYLHIVKNGFHWTHQDS